MIDFLKNDCEQGGLQASTDDWRYAPPLTAAAFHPGLALYWARLQLFRSKP
jgi:hypothetical protein